MGPARGIDPTTHCTMSYLPLWYNFVVHVVYIYNYMCTWHLGCVCVYVHVVCVCVYVCVYVCVCVHVCMCMCVYVMCVCVHVYIEGRKCFND